MVLKLELRLRRFYVGFQRTAARKIKQQTSRNDFKAHTKENKSTFIFEELQTIFRFPKTHVESEPELYNRL